MKMISFDKLSFVPAGHEDPQSPGVLKKVLFACGDLQSGTVRMANWAKLLPGRSFASHYHEDMQEVFIMVAGAARLVIDGAEVVLAPGDAVRIDPGEVHEMFNDTNEPAEYLAIGVANGDGDTVVVE
jgi:mannose-6-phosphate isomerase-like protein (cupin superfamily)